MNTPATSDRGVWRMAGGDPARRASFAGPAHRARPAKRSFEAQGAIQASIVFDAAGTAFVADMAGGVQAFTPAGQRRWRVRLDGGISATPALDPTDQLLFVGTHAGDLVALDATTGTLRWRRPLPTRKDPRILSDLLHLPRSGLVVASSWGGRFFACHGATGEPRFDWDAGIAPRSAAAADADENIYTIRSIAGRGTELVRTAAAGGEAVLYREPEDSRGAGRALVAAGPVVDPERGTLHGIVNRGTLGQLVAWSLARGTVSWKRELAAPAEAPPTIAPDGVVFVAGLSGRVQAFDPDGTPRFECALPCEYLLAGGAFTGTEGEASKTTHRFVIGDPVGIVHALDARGTARALFEAPRSFQSRPSFDPAGHLHLGCTDRGVYRSTDR